MRGLVDKTGNSCLLVLGLFTSCQSINVQKTFFKVISVCSKGYKRTATTVASYQSLSRLDCAVRCSLTTKCSGINYCNISGKSDCEFLPNVSSALSCDDLEHKDGCVYLHKGPCSNGGFYDPVEGVCQCPYSFTGIYCERYFKDCIEAFDLGYRHSALTMVEPSEEFPPFELKCRMNDKPMARIVKRHAEGTDHFIGKSWNDFKYGFGLPAKNNMWLGLEKIRYLLNIREERFIARISVTFKGDDVSYNGYLDDFYIASEADDFKLTYSGYRTEGAHPLPDAFTETGTNDTINGRPFCTPDKDCGECAKNNNNSGWWFSCDCAGININSPADAMVWPNGSQSVPVEKINIDIFPLNR